MAASPGGPSPFAGRAEELEPILGQFLLDPVDGEPLEAAGGLVVEPLAGAVLEDPEEPAVAEEPDVAVVPVPVPVVDPLVAASAISAPPATRPVVNAPMASTLRGRSFMGCVLPSDRYGSRPSLGPHRPLCGLDLCAGP
ncbi:MAG: hypothetical protein ACLQRH_04570 [Acidimicrobiales bacterium]